MKIWEVAAGVFIGSLAALFAHDWILASAAAYAAKEALKQMEATTRAANREVRRLLPPTPDPADEAARQAAERQRELAEEAKLNAQAKEATFQRRFKPSPRCQTDSGTMDCANEYLRARKAFDAGWHNQTPASGPVTLPR